MPKFVCSTKPGHHDEVLRVTWHPKAEVNSFATGGADGMIYIWNASNGKEKAAITAVEEEQVYYIDICDDGEILIAGYDDKISFWPVDEVREQPITTFTFDNYSKTAVFGGERNQEEKCYVFDAARMPRTNDNVLAISLADSTVRIQDIRNKQMSFGLKGWNEDVYSSSCSFSKDGRYLSSTSGDGLVAVWDTRTWRQLYLLHGHDGPCFGSTFVPIPLPPPPLPSVVTPGLPLNPVPVPMPMPMLASAATGANESAQLISQIASASLPTLNLALAGIIPTQVEANIDRYLLTWSLDTTFGISTIKDHSSMALIQQQQPEIVEELDRKVLHDKYPIHHISISPIRSKKNQYRMVLCGGENSILGIAPFMYCTAQLLPKSENELDLVN